MSASFPYICFVSKFIRHLSAEMGQLMSSMRDFATDNEWNWMRAKGPQIRSGVHEYVRFEHRGSDTYELCVLEGWPTKASPMQIHTALSTKHLVGDVQPTRRLLCNQGPLSQTPDNPRCLQVHRPDRRYPRYGMAVHRSYVILVPDLQFQKHDRLTARRPTRSPSNSHSAPPHTYLMPSFSAVAAPRSAHSSSQQTLPKIFRKRNSLNALPRPSHLPTSTHPLILSCRRKRSCFCPMGRAYRGRTREAS